MNSVRSQEVLKSLNAEILKIRESAKKTDEASKQRLTGWSASGDKYHAQAAADLTNSYLKRMELLKKELEESSSNTPEIIEPPCAIRIEFNDGGVGELVLVKNAVSLPQTSFISVDSPLGKAILGKKNGDIFSYDSSEGKNYSGKIVSLE